ncbi:hypothetical protein BGZ58_006040 [Dissophora ornata]|nr:hypothetical protein BGZ58_006040 [Dissophora ornata]
MMQDFTQLSVRRATSSTPNFKASIEGTSSKPLLTTVTRPGPIQPASSYGTNSLFSTDYEKSDWLEYQERHRTARKSEQGGDQELDVSNRTNCKQFSLFEGSTRRTPSSDDVKVERPQFPDSGVIPWCLDTIEAASIDSGHAAETDVSPGVLSIVSSTSMTPPDYAPLHRLSAASQTVSSLCMVSPCENSPVNPPSGQRYLLGSKFAPQTPQSTTGGSSDTQRQVVDGGEQITSPLSPLPTGPLLQLDDNDILRMTTYSSHFSKQPIGFSLNKDAGVPTRYLKISNVSRDMSIWDARDALKSYGDLKGIFTTFLGSDGVIFIEFFDIRHAMTASRRLYSNPTFSSSSINIQFCPKVFMSQVSPETPINENEGTLEIAVWAPRLSDNDLLRLIASFGDVRSFQTESDGWPLVALAEYYDTRQANFGKTTLQELHNKAQIHCQVSFYQKDRVQMFGCDQQHQNQQRYGSQDTSSMLGHSSHVERLAVSPGWILYARAQQRADPATSSFSVGPSGIEYVQQQVASPPVFSNLSDTNLALQFQNPSGYMDRPSSNGPASISTVEDVRGRTSVPDAPASARGTLTYASATVSGANSTSVNSLTASSAADKRTTFMIRNIPNKYTQQMLLQCINETHFGKFDFLYLRMDFKNKCNVGYAFINFTSTDVVASFVKEHVGKKWSRFNSDKICSLSYAAIQGRRALIEKFRNSSVMNEDPTYRPKIFYTSGPNIGMEEPFPEPTISKDGSRQNIRSRGSNGRQTDC